MYTEKDYQENQAQLKKRLILLGIPALVLLGAVVWSFIVRIKLLTMALTIVLGAFIIFCYGMLISPVAAYGRHIADVLYGRTHSLTGAFKEMDEKTVVRDGVEYYPVILNVGDMNDPEDDRLFYYDANLQKPDWQVGESITVTAHDKALGAWQRA